MDDLSSSRSRLESLLDAFQGRHLLVVGDLILDRFIWGEVDRISPEAPVPVVYISNETVHLGGAANVAANLVGLGAVPHLVGLVGEDLEGRTLLKELEKEGIDPAGVISSDRRATTVKTRIIARHQQVCRTDREDRHPLPESEAENIERRAARELGQIEAVILSDYGKGILTGPTTASLIARCHRNDCFVAVDPRPGDFSDYRSASLITPNKKEAEQASGITIADETSLQSAGAALLERTRAQSLLITRGEEGMTLFEAEGHSHIPTVAREVFDVTGAGDTVIAALTLAVACDANLREAAFLANHAAGIVVGKLGTAAVSSTEIRDSVDPPGR